jgi:lipid II:glycine glycyltransferase (peptidoglycan interpeptide bridge formation enzyme)
MSNGDNMIHVIVGHQLPDGLPSPDVFFTPGYGRAISVSEGGEWVLLEAFDGAWQAPLILRTLVDGTKDAISPHFSGIFASPSLSSGQIQAAWRATAACLRELGAISVLLRHSPHVPQAPHIPEQQSIVSAHPSIVLEPADSESAWTGLASTCRTRIRKARKNGYTSDVRQASAQDLAADSDFRRLYEGTMQRLDAAPVYFFSDKYYRELHNGLGANLLIAEVQNPDGVPVSSALLMRHGDLLHYHLTGSSWDDARMGTNNLMLWTATEYAAEQGLRQFHLGGGHAKRDELFRFKHTFGGREIEYDISGLVIDQNLYRAHVEIQAKECATTSEALMTSNFFPAYRGGLIDASQ